MPLASDGRRPGTRCPTSITPPASDRTRTRRSPSATTAAAAPSSAPAPAGRREALLRALLRRPRGARRRDAVPGERHPRPRHPARAARGGRRALPPLRRGQPDQRPEQGADRGAGEGARGGRRRPAGLLGQPQLGALRRGHLAADGRRRHRARLRLRDVGLRLVLRLPAVPRGRRPGPRRADRAPAGPTAEKLPHYFDAPGFVQANADALAAALARAARTTSATPPGWSRRRTASRTRWPPSPGPQGARLRGASCTAAAQAVVDAAAPGRPFDLVWQSRSGPPSVPWLEPDVNDHLRALAAAGEQAVVLFPVGFVSDHLEVIWDLDNEAQGDRRRARAGLRAGGDGRHAPGVRRDRCANCSRSAAPAGSRGWAPTARRPAASSPDRPRPADRRWACCSRITGMRARDACSTRPARASPRDVVERRDDRLADRVGERAQRVVAGRRPARW